MAILRLQRGSILLDTVLFMGLLSVFFMALVGQLTFMTKVSAQEDARVQGLMAARVQMENMRTRWLEEWDPEDVDPLTGETFCEAVFSIDAAAFDRLGEEGHFRITIPDEAGAPHLYQIEIWVDSKTGQTVYRTFSQVWVQ